jgi:EpsD family peptidyl-prolyl cis-trans isomerase
MNHARKTPAVAPRALRLPTLALAAMLVLSTGCGERKTPHGESPAAARVNQQEIKLDQINFLLQRQPGLRPEQLDAASRRILERLIEQELAMQKALDLKLDQTPGVVQQVEAARREIVARAYVEHVGESAAKPTAQEIQQYYDDKPALFKERRIYSLQELAIEARPEQIEALRNKLAAAKNIAEFIDYLKAGEFRFSGNQAVRAAEQLPLASLDTIAKLKDGQSLFNGSATGAQVLVLAGSRSQPISLEQAKAPIENFLLNERKRKLVEDEIKSLRSKAKIEYAGKFAAAASSPDSSTLAEPAASAASN